MTPTNWTRPAAALAVAIALSALAGCGSEGRAISGEVTVDGQPMEDGAILFVPDGGGSGRSEVGASIVNGKYSVEEGRGPKPGKYKVQIRWMKKTGKKFQGADGVEDEKVQALPPKFNTETTLTAEVKGGKNTINFPLTSN
jgi:hypothetical protein